MDLRGDELAEVWRGMAPTTVRDLEPPPATSYELRRLLVDLADGRRLDVLIKNFGVSPHSRQAALERGRRESYVYETALAGRHLGTAQLYAAVWDDVGDRHMIAMEFVDGHKLGHSLENRIAAAAWLARLQGSVIGVESELARSGVLLRYDGDYLLETAEQAQEAVGSRMPDLLGRLQRAVRRYPSTVGAMTSDPPTLVHGSYRSKNVLIDRRGAALRVCPLDWELAALGPALHDLAFLADGRDPEEVRRLCEAYAAEAAAAGLSVPEIGELTRRLQPLRLHRTLRSLARSAMWRYPVEAVSRLVTTAETLARDLA